MKFRLGRIHTRHIFMAVFIDIQRVHTFWLRYEESAERIGTVELRLTSWPGSVEQLLATGGHHYEPLQWLAPSAAAA